MSTVAPVSVSIVVIGLNEARNLEECFRAIGRMDYPRDKLEVIYVDSGSRDSSVSIAERFADRVFIEKAVRASAARSRNRGITEAQHDLVHFVDGDVAIDRAYLREAVKALLDHLELCAAFGGLEERRGGLNGVLLSPWKKKQVGRIDSPGGGGTFRRSALLAVGGYDERILRGEESELGARLRSAGFEIAMVAQRMGIHNHDLVGVKSYFMRSILEGRSLALNSMLRPRSAFFLRESRAARNNVLVCAAALAAIVACIVTGRAWWAPMVGLALPLYALVKYGLVRGEKDPQVLLYYVLMQTMRPVVFLGQLGAYAGRLAKGRTFVGPRQALERPDAGS